METMLQVVPPSPNEHASNKGAPPFGPLEINHVYKMDSTAEYHQPDTHQRNKSSNATIIKVHVKSHSSY